MTVSHLLETISQLSGQELEFLFDCMDEGMWDEWDTSLSNGLTMFGNQELKIALRTAAIRAKYIESLRDSRVAAKL